MKFEKFFIIGIIFIVIVIGIMITAGQEVRRTRQELVTIKGQIDKMVVHIENSSHQRITVTSNHPASGGINSDKDPGRTAIMRKPVPGYTLAISDELFYLGWLDKKIYIDGWGVGKASDRMGYRIVNGKKVKVKGKHIDICAPSLKWAEKFGIKKGVLAVVLQ